MSEQSEWKTTRIHRTSWVKLRKAIAPYDLAQDDFLSYVVSESNLDSMAKEYDELSSWADEEEKEEDEDEEEED